MVDETLTLTLTVGLQPPENVKSALRSLNAVIAGPSTTRVYDPHCSLFVFKVYKGTYAAGKFMEGFHSIPESTWQYIIENNCTNFHLGGSLCGLGLGKNENKFFALSLNERFADTHEVLVQMMHEIKARTGMRFRCRPNDGALEIWHSNFRVGSVENYWFGKQHITVAHTNGCVRDIRDDCDGERRIQTCVRRVLPKYRAYENETCVMSKTRPFISVGRDLKFSE